MIKKKALKALKEYAKSKGVSVDELTESEKSRIVSEIVKEVLNDKPTKTN